MDKLKGTLLETPSPKTKHAEKENQGDKGINIIIVTQTVIGSVEGHSGFLHDTT